MTFFDAIKNQVTSQFIKEKTNDNNRTESFIFERLPANIGELEVLPEASLDSAFKTTALCIAVLCNFKKDTTATWEMLDYLKGPENVSEREKAFIKERLAGKEYKTFSFFKGATPKNQYVPDTPYTITVSMNGYSFEEENWATLYVTSGGADAPRPIKLRRKPSTNQWFINDILCLADIRIPTQQDAWA